MTTVNRPVAFPGTEAEKRANYATHCFVSWDPDDCTRCTYCDCKTWHVAADYPCGQEPPRETVAFAGCCSGKTPLRADGHTPWCPNGATTAADAAAHAAGARRMMKSRGIA